MRVLWLLKTLLLLPLKLLGGGAKAAAAATAGSFRLGYGAGRLVGYKRIVLLGLGAVAALLLTPFTGAQLRERVARLVGGRTGAGQAVTVPPPAHGPTSEPPSATPAPSAGAATAATATADVSGITEGEADVPADAGVVDTTRPVDAAALEDPATTPDGPVE